MRHYEQTAYGKAIGFSYILAYFQELMYDKYLILDKNMTPLAPSSRNMFHNLNISKLGGYKLSKKMKTYDQTILNRIYSKSFMKFSQAI